MKSVIISAATLATVLAAGFSGTVAAQDNAKEKCYGVAKAGANDCANASGTHSCAGQAKKDNDGGEWKYVAKGTCEGMKGTLKPAMSK